MFNYEENIADQESLHSSDIMISDWSGAALDYAFGLSKPVLFIDVPRKINNPDYKEIDVEPIEIFIRGKIGDVIKLDEISNINKTIEKVSKVKIDKEKLTKHVFKLQTSSFYGCEKLKEILNEK